MGRKLATENAVKDMVKRWFNSVGAWHYAPIQNGMGVHGIHDRIGCVPVTITPDMVGKTFGLFVSVESKRPGRRGEKNRGMSEHQLHSLLEIRNAGGQAICCDSEEDLAILHRNLFQMELPNV